MRIPKRLSVALAALAVVAIPGATLAAGLLVVDRGLPTANLNNAAGANRSNVAWSFGSDYLSGDDFVVGAAGELWVITNIRTWSIGGAPSSTYEIGDRFQDVTLYGGVPSDAVPAAIATGNLAVGSSTNSNPDITHTKVTYAGGADYQGSGGSYIQIWQNDFNHLNWVVQGGQTYVFAADGELQPAVTYWWFNHASNAALSGSPQQGSDDLFWYWAKDGSDAGQWDSGALGGGWDKSSDINAQITAAQVATSKGLCKAGWQSLVRADGSSFKSQGDCIQYVNTGK